MTRLALAARPRRPLLMVFVGLAVLLLPASGLSATVLERVNAGGPMVSGTPGWSADTAASPSPYVNASEIGNLLYSTAAPIDLTHPSVPPGTPEALFQTERYDLPGGAPMQWSFPVSAGRHEVRLFLADIYPGTHSTGARVFDVYVEEALVLDDYDIFAEVGAYKGVVKSFVVTSDAALNIRFEHVVENPAIKAIEVLDAPAVPDTLAVSPTSLGFGSVSLGGTRSSTVQVTNTGGPGDPAIVVDATSLTGPNASEFSDAFDDASDVALAPGDSTSVTVTMAPTSSGSKAATLEIVHSGTNTPLSVPLSGTATDGATPGTWKSLAPSGPDRQEVSYVFADGKFYLAGGGTAHEAYDPATDTWSAVAPLPAFVDHIQGVELGGKIYYIGGLQSWPGPHTDTVDIYDPKTNTFARGAKMPRGRGAGGVAAYQGKIYYAGGLANGVAVPWFDVYDPVANTWTQLPDMPTARDHFHAAVVNAKLYAIGGRNRDIDATTAANEAYDFATGSWETGLAPLPTPRGGFAAAALGDEILVIGGEGGGKTFGTVEAYNTTTNTWRALTSMPTPRHGVQAAVCNGGVYLAAGGKTQGGGSPSDTHEVMFLGQETPCAAAPVGFGKSVLKGATVASPTSLQFGPDGRLYVAQQDGIVKAYTVARSGANDYTITATETITSIQSIPNHNDDGSLNASVTTRQITGILVVGSAANPVLYVGSSDPRIGAGPDGSDSNLDTNSSMLSRLTRSGSSWNRVDLVRGLPRSEENHSINGMQLDPVTNVLYAAIGGNTNEGAPSNNFALLPEFALSAAIVSVDLSAIGNATYDLPTLDDEDRPGSPDTNDPFGGNDGKNQAKLVSQGPVQVYAAGFRNAYDLLITASRRMYTIDNGGNAGWGAPPVNEGPEGVCTNEVSEAGETEPDMLHLVTGPGYYGGHPNPTRGSKSNTFNANKQSPVDTANPIECDYRAPTQRGVLTTWPMSTNGLAEYTASNFGQAMKGDLLAASFDNKIYRVELNATGDQVVSNDALFASVGSNAWSPLDVIAQGDSDPFPGTIWVADWSDGLVRVFEPNDFGAAPPACSGSYDVTLDEDGDGYSNADEMDNGTSPCSAADVPPDWDNDKISNVNDPDDDNDGTPDTSDLFAIDSANGMTTALPVHHSWNNDAPRAGGLMNLGFTGLMTNGVADYETLYDPAGMTAGGAAGVTTVDKVPDGDALGSANTQRYGFQFGFKPPETGQFTVRTRILGPFAGLTPEGSQSMGIFLGTGDQDNYVKLVTSANGGAGGVQFLKEVGGAVTTRPQESVSLPGPDWVDLFLTVDVAAGTVQPSYVVTTSGVPSARTAIGAPDSLPASWLAGSQALAVGLIATSAGPAPEFPASWDFIEAVPGDGTATAVASDTFTRSTSSGWGTADAGGSWSIVAGSAASFAVDGQRGTVTTPAGSIEQRAHLAAVSTRDVDARAALAFPNVPSGGSIFSYVTLRGRPDGAYYRIGLFLTPSGQVVVRGQTHAGIHVFPDIDTGMMFAPGDVFVLRVQAEGASPTTLRAKAWKRGSSEPSGWTVTGSDSTAGLQDAGTLGIRTINLSGGAMTLAFDDLLAVGLGQSPTDATPPTVSGVTPETGASSVGVGTNVTATFSEAIDAATLTAATFTLVKQGTSSALAAAVSYDVSTKTATLDPTSDLDPGAVYVATVKGGSAGVKDLSGNSLAQDHSWSFTTSAGGDTNPPTVTGVTPHAGASAVPVGTTVTATFSEAIDAATLTAATFTLVKQGTSSALAAAVSYDVSTKTATLDPTSDLDPGAVYVATVKGGSAGVKDLSGNSLAQDHVWSFTTAGGISLTVSGYKVKGLHKADLTWAGATSALVDVYRNGVKVATTANDGAHTDNVDARGSATYTYKLCEAGANKCSAQISVTV